MKYFYLIFAICGFSCTQSPVKGHTKLAPDAFELAIKANGNVPIIDVRTPTEFSEGHLAQAQNINIQAADFTAQVGRLDKQKPVFVYCAVGGRSAQAANQLISLGFQQVYDLKGGITAWKKAGKPLDK